MSDKVYPLLKSNTLSIGEYALVPLRYQDIFSIMEWRNQQLYHLRQDSPLTRDDQENYYQNVVKRSFREKHPKQFLFSFLENNKCIGYGGLVHINWVQKEGEISFLIDTEREKKDFQKLWLTYLDLIEEIAFSRLGLKKIFIYSYDIRPKLYAVLEKAEYYLEKIVPEAIEIDGKQYNVKINSKFHDQLRSRGLIWDDSALLFEWINDKQTRSKSLDKKPIKWKDHCKWFKERILNHSANNFIFLKDTALGFLRLDNINDRLNISLHVAPSSRGKGVGKKMIAGILQKKSGNKFQAEVISTNLASSKIFLQNGFCEVQEYARGEETIKLYHYPK